MTSELNILFIPVSSIKGIGEYMRSLILADEISKQYADAKITFVLNGHTTYAASCPYETKLLDSSPTNHNVEVNRIIEEFQPQIVIFDASGRKSQLAKAKSVGATTVFVSQHQKKRRRGMAWKRAKHTDFHFVAQPEFAIKPITLMNRVKFALLNKALPECVGIFFNQPTSEQANNTLKLFSVEKNEYILVSAGSGGHKKNEQWVADEFFATAERIEKKTGLKTIIVMGPSYPNSLPESKSVTVLSKLDNMNFIALLENAKLAVLSGGGSLLQALALQTPVIACPVSKDQPARIDACMKNKLLLTVSLEQMIEQVPPLIIESNIQMLKTAMQQQPSSNGVNTIIERLSLTEQKT